MRTLFGPVLSLITAVAICQTYNPGMSNPSQWYINNQMYSTRVFNGMVANSMLRKGSKSSKPVTATAGKVSSFKWSGSILPKMLATKVEGKDKAAIERFFQSHLDLYRQTATKDGFPANDLAYAFEYFVVNNYHLYHDLIGSPRGVTMVQERAVFNQFKQMLAANADVKKMTDRQKQEGVECLAILFGVNYTAYQNRSSARGQELFQKARAMAKEGLERLLGASISQIKITNSGIEI
jgi:hypothetical protein